MLRAFSMFSLGAIFLAISPHLRQQVSGAIGSGVSAMDFYAPYSYVAGGLLLLFALMVSLYRGAQAR